MMIIVEIVAILVIVGLQIRAFLGNRAKIGRLAAMFPEGKQLLLVKNTDFATGQEADLLVSPGATTEFAGVLADANSYLLKNKGTADFGILQDITERRVDALDGEIQATTSTPLYIGLMGTFGGAILGLVSLGLAGEEFNTADINHFLLGVTIAMLGSLCGLGLTLWGNSIYKDARHQAETRRNEFYTFLQAQLLPILHSDMASSLGNLKSVLDSFNQEFLSKIYEFGPIVSALNENIGTQKDFLQELQKVGYTQMADASIRVFAKVAESAHHFENFIEYQKSLNQTLLDGRAVADKIQNVLVRLTRLEEGLNMVPALLQQHSDTVSRQVALFNESQARLDQMGHATEKFFDESYHQLAEMMRVRMGHFQSEAQQAAEKWQEHFRVLNRDNIYERIIEYMKPFGNLAQQQSQLNKQQDTLSQVVVRTNERMLEKMTQDSATNAQLLAQMQILNELLEKATAKGPVGKMVERVFGGGKPATPASKQRPSS